MMTIVATLLLGAAGSVLAAELLGICPALTRKLLARALRRLPEDQRDRYLMEWEGDLDFLRTVRGNMAILLWAVGVYFSSRRLSAMFRNSPAHNRETSQREQVKHHPAAQVPAAQVTYAGSYKHATLIRPFDNYYESLLQLDARNLDVIRTALHEIARDPHQSHVELVDDHVIFVKRIMPSLVDGELLPARLVFYLSERRENVVRPLLQCRVAELAPRGLESSDDEILVALRRTVREALHRIKRHRNH